jgi:hypothetical protein
MTQIFKDIINTCSALFAKNKLDGNVNLLQVLVNPYFYSNNGEFSNIISEHLEPLCRFQMYAPVAIFRPIGILIISLMLALIVVASG